jgi:hypothetical protein
MRTRIGSLSQIRSFAPASALGAGGIALGLLLGTGEDARASEMTYQEFHRAIRAVELCEDRTFGLDAHLRMAPVIRAEAGVDVPVGRQLSLIEAGKAEAFDMVFKYGCDSSEVAPMLTLFQSKLAPAL